MAPKNPLGRLADTAIKSLKDPVGTAGKVVEQAKGGAAFGRMVAEQVGRTAVSKATETAGAVVSRATGHNPEDRPGSSAPRAESSPLRSVPDVNEPAHTTGPIAEEGTGQTKRQGDPVEEAVKRTGAKAAKKAPAKKTAKKSTGKAAASPADVAKAVEAAVAEDPGRTAATPAKKGTVKKDAAKKAPAKKAPAKKAPAKKAAKTAPGDRLPTKRAAKKAPPKSAQQLAELEGEDLSTPVGTPAAEQGLNPDTGQEDLNQRGTEGIVEPSTAKKVASEAKTRRKAAEREPE